MGVSKVVYGENTLVDLTADTVTAETLVEGATAHDAAGNAVTGTNPYAKEETDNTVNEQEQLIEEIVTALAERCVVTEPILQSKTVTPSKEEQTVAPDAGYDGLSSVVVNASPSAVLQAKTVTPSKVQQVVTPDSGYDGLSSVTVEAAQSGEGTYGWRKCVSKLPSGYTEVEYLQSSGTQYIDTGIGTVHTITMDVQFNNTGKEALMGQSANGGFYFGINASGYIVDGRSNAFSYLGTVRRTIDIVGTTNSQVITVGDETRTQSRSTTVSATFKLLGGISGYPCSAKLFSCQFYSGSTLIRDFVPCTNASGTAGLYDLVNDVFYINAGSGTFAVGAAIDNIVGYVVSDDANAYPNGEFLDGYYYKKL